MKHLPPLQPPSNARALLDGVGAGGALLVVELGARALWTVPTLPELMQDRLVRALPGPLFAFLLDHLLYLGKPALFSGLLCVQLVLSVVAALGVAHLRRPFELAFALWLGTELIVLPIAGKGAFAGSIVVAGTSFVAYAAWAAMLAFSWQPSARRQLPGLPQRVYARRDVLGGGGFLALAAVLARLSIGNLPALAAKRGRLPDPISSPSEFYVVSKNLIDPVVDEAGWRLKVDGLVDHPLTLSLADIRAMPAQHAVRTLECISNEVGGDLISNGEFTGVRLADVLQLAGPHPAGRFLRFTSADDYTEGMAVAKAMAPETLLAYELDGQPLPSKHGFPLRVLGAGTYGMKNPKWLQRIEVVAPEPGGFWEAQGWSKDAIVRTMSRIDVPQEGFAASDLTIEGIAFAGDRAISRVEVSSDGGTTWSGADLSPVAGPLAWVFWRLQTMLSHGLHDLVVRAIDGDGAVQDHQSRDPYPDGATGYDRVGVEVDS